jgi:hypothetical protein
MLGTTPTAGDAFARTESPLLGRVLINPAMELAYLNGPRERTSCPTLRMSSLRSSVSCSSDAEERLTQRQHQKINGKLSNDHGAQADH